MEEKRERERKGRRGRTTGAGQSRVNGKKQRPGSRVSGGFGGEI